MSKRQALRRTLLFIFFFIFPITLNYYSPVIIIQGAFDRTLNFSFVFWAAYLITAIVIGRSACGYICPLGSVQEIKDTMGPRPLIRVPYLSVVKYLLAAAWIGVIIYGIVSSGGYQQVNLLYNTENIVSIENINNLITYYMVLVITILPVFLMGRRAFCRYFCPFSILNIVGDKLGRLIKNPYQLHMEAAPGRCTQCNTCTRNCQMSLDVKSMVQSGNVYHTECILCGQCVDSCKAGALHYEWKR